jgi:hypothetical protein
VSGKERHFVEELERATAVPVLSEVVPQAAEPGSTLTRRFRPNATIVTQLWATKLDAPQARARRRAEPEEGVAAYGEAGQTIARGRRRTGPSWAA